MGRGNWDCRAWEGLGKTGVRRVEEGRQVVGWGRESGEGPGRTLAEGYRAGCGFAIVRDR